MAPKYYIFPEQRRNYDPEQFDTPTNVEFQIVRLLMPCPSVFVYPKNYNGVVDNIAEGILVKFPAIPISANAVYTNAEKTADLWSIINSTLMGGINGARSGGAPGAILGAGFNAVGNYSGISFKELSAVARQYKINSSGLSMSITKAEDTVLFDSDVYRDDAGSCFTDVTNNLSGVYFNYNRK